MDDKQYVKDGLKYDRVTRVLDYFANPDLVAWKVKVGSRESKRIGTIAKNIGSNVDEYIKAEIEGVKLPKLKTQEAKNCVEAWNQWRKDYNLELKDLRVGVTEYDNDMMVAGTPDLWTYDACIDVKCSTEIRSVYWLQVNWYAFRKVAVQNRAILRLDKNIGTYEYMIKPMSIEELDVFNGLLKAYRYFQQFDNKETDDGIDVTDDKTGSTEDLDETEVSDDRTGRNRKIGLLESWRKDSVY